MNCLQKNSLSLIVSVVFLATACTKKDIEFGNSLGETYTNLLQVDTVSVALSTYAVDSFVTNGIADFVAGRYRDSVTGTVSAKAYLQLMPALGATLPDDAVFDSLSFVIRLNHYSYGDTAQTQTVSINELAQPIEYRYGSYIYNTSSFAEKATPLGTRQTKIFPARNDSIAVRLSDAKGAELFSMIRNGDAAMQTADEFLNYFKGVSVNITSATPSAVYGFTKAADSVFMRLHYHTSIPYPEAKYTDFAFYSGLYSNRIVADRNGTPFASLANGEVSSLLTGNKSYTQAGAGLLLKMTFPTLRNLLQLNPTVKLLKATLVLKVPGESYGGTTPLPQTLLLAQTDASYAFSSYLYNSSGEALTLSPSYDNLYGATTSYSIDLTTYINGLLTTAGSEAKGLFLLQNVPGASGKINRAAFANSAAAANNSQLVLSLLTLKK